MNETCPVAGPLCAYWDVEDAPMCGHASCYVIVAGTDQPWVSIYRDCDHTECHPSGCQYRPAGSR